MKELPVSDMVSLETSRAKGGTRPCVRFFLWILAFLAVCFSVLLCVFIAWTLVSYHNTVISLQNRMETLEKDCSSGKKHIEEYIEKRLEELLQTVSILTFFCMTAAALFVH